MSLEAALVERMERLIAQASDLRIGGPHGQVRSDGHAEQCRGWIAAAVNAISVATGGGPNPYLDSAERIAARQHGYVIQKAVGELSETLTQVLSDMEAGLLGSVADHARAETFDNFLDHGQAYLNEGSVREAGVIVGVVFEDSVRRICRKHSITEAGVKLDALISELVKANVVTAVKAKRARVAAHVRTQATHAQWDQFTPSDVAEALGFTRELVEGQLDV